MKCSGVCIGEKADISKNLEVAHDMEAADTKIYTAAVLMVECSWWRWFKRMKFFNRGATRNVSQQSISLWVKLQEAC